MLVRVLSLSAVIMLGALCSGCFLFTGVKDIDVTMHVPNMASGEFAGYTDITVDHDVDSVSKVTLVGVTLDVTAPAGTPDLSFLLALKGDATLNGQDTPLVSGTDFAKGQPSVALDVEYSGDIRPMFQGGHVLRVNWTGSTDPSYPAWPADGFTLDAKVAVDVQ